VLFDGGVGSVSYATVGGGAGSSSSSLIYASTAFALSGSGQTFSPTVNGGTAESWDLQGDLPSGVTFTDGVFTGPEAWNFTATQISSVSASTCALTSLGGVKCWGWNEYGQLGDGTTTDRSTPVDVVGLTSGVTQVTAGGDRTCAVTTSGGAKCWGANFNGALGDGTTTNRSTPVDVTGLTSGVASISTNGSHVCALTTTGGVKCWGFNGRGQLGDGTTTNRSTPVDVVGLTSGVTQVSAGSEHTCAITTGGAAKCWGRNNHHGQLGDGTTTNRSTPVDVLNVGGAPFTGVAQISAGDNHTCARTTSGAAKCWGGYSSDQLGRGELWDGTNDNYPGDVEGLSSGVLAVVATSYRGCALITGGGVKCWGSNWADTAGSLGDGITWNERQQAPAPVDVLGFGNPGFPASVTVTVTFSGGGTASANLTLTIG